MFFCTSLYVLFAILFYKYVCFCVAVWFQPMRDRVCTPFHIIHLAYVTICTMYMYIHANLRCTCHFRSLFVDSRLVPFLVIHVVVFFKVGGETKNYPLMKNVTYTDLCMSLCRCVCRFPKCNNQNIKSGKSSRFNTIHLLEWICSFLLQNIRFLETLTNIG